MALAQLPPTLLMEVFDCLGPAFSCLRATCLRAKACSCHLDIYLQILKWHCVNSLLLENAAFAIGKVVEVLGKMPIRCSECLINGRFRQMYRIRCRHPGVSSVKTNAFLICSLCVFREMQTFLAGAKGLLSRAGWQRQDMMRVGVAIMCRIYMPSGGFVEQFLASLRPSGGSITMGRANSIDIHPKQGI
jgi:hypothetical protein